MLVNKRFLSDFFELYVASMMKETRKKSVKIPAVFSMYGQYCIIYDGVKFADIFVIQGQNILPVNGKLSLWH